MSDYDVIVIGAGNGGLTAAAALAQNKLKVLLLERHNVPGGCATSFCRGRFEFEVALHQLSGLGTSEKPGPLRDYLSRLGVADQLQWVEMKNLYRIILPGQLDITLSTDRAALISTLQERFPAEKDNITRFFDLVYNFYYELIRAFFLKDPEVTKEKYPLYFKYALKSSRDVLDEHFSDPLLKMAVSPYWCYVGVPPSALPFSDLAALLFAYMEFKPFHLKGGSQALSNTLVDQILAAGGHVRFNCAAQKILVKDGRVTGVLTETGETITADYVVSNASTLDAYVEMIDRDQIPDEQFKILGGSTVGPSSLTLYIGLDCEPGEVGITETTNFIGDYTDFEKAFAQTRKIETEEDMVLVTCYNVSDPDFSPPGTCQVVIVDLEYAEPWMAVPPAQYADTKYRCAEALLQRIEKVFPGFREHIEEIEVATPLTHMRYLNTPGGAIYGFDQYPKDSSLFVSNRPPIKGLFFAGAWAGSGGFQPTLMSGGAAAKAVLRNYKSEKGGN